MSKRVNLYHNEEMCAHTHAWAHVEKCTRALHCYQHLEKRGLLKSVTVHGGHSADDRELMTVHSQRHIDEVKRLSAAAKADPTNRKLREPDGPGGIYYSDAADASARWPAAAWSTRRWACSRTRRAAGRAHRRRLLLSGRRPPRRRRRYRRPPRGGLLLLQQRRRRRGGRARQRPRKEDCDPRLGRPPRQRYAGHLLQ